MSSAAPQISPDPSDDPFIDSSSHEPQSSASIPASRSPSPSAHPPRMILYTPPTVWSLLRGAAINLILPFVNGLMLGFGELLAHEAAYRLGWNGTKIFPTTRTSSTSHSLGPGVEVRDDPVEAARRWREREGRRREREMEDLTSLE